MSTVLKKMILFITSDGVNFEVEEAVAAQFQAINDMFDDISAVTSIPLTNITGEVFSKVLQYCRRHAEAGSGEADLDSFDADFVKVDHSTLFDLILAANYLNVKGLLDLASQTLGNMMMGKTVEEIRRHFNIPAPPEDENQVERGPSWAFE